MSTRYGTSHFYSWRAAVKYYSAQGFNEEDVQRKIDEREIHIGPPMVYRGARLTLIEGRYFIEEAQ